MSCRPLIVPYFALLLLIGCSRPDVDRNPDSNSPLFQLLSPDHTGVTFTNSITTSDSVHMLNNVFIYNGAGVAAGDINNDGLPDLYFTGNMVSGRLYLNRGEMQFEDVTQKAGVNTDRWTTGVSMADINGDGLTDIYVSVSGSKHIPAEQRRNLLFINNGDTTFTEAAADFGLDDPGFTSHTAFLDYDRDGDLDLFLLGNSPREFSRGDTGSLPMGGEKSADPVGFDQLYRNNGDGSFTNVSEEAGILKKLGYGLGVAVSDLNGDDWPDIYVSNDLTPNDVLYINNGDGTFTDRAAEWLRHTSFAGMGIDIADFTNNGRPDIMQIDMMPEELSVRKRMSGTITYSTFMSLRRQGYFPHYNINSLQMNLGTDAGGRVIFSEIARMANVAYTNWSWSTLFGDFDNDGLKDLIVTNGFPKMGMDLDYLSDKHQAGQADDPATRRREILEQLPGYEVSNYLYRNEGDLTFSNKTKEWGMDQPGYSYGAAYADLDNDGRQDIVINNIDSPVSIYKNAGPADSTSHYLTVKLRGAPPNTDGIGAKLTLTAGKRKQYIYHNPYRGFKSTVDGRIHFGLGEAETADTLHVLWPDGSSQLLTDIPADRMITVNREEATQQGTTTTEAAPRSRKSGKTFNRAAGARNLEFRHRQAGYVDYSVQPLLPYMISRQGPPIAVDDVTGDGLEDLFVGGSEGQPGVLFIQQQDGTFSETGRFQPWTEDSDREDWDALFFDANGDGRPDLYVASGGYQSTPASLLLQDRLYINHGEGRFLKDEQALPDMLTSTGSVAAADFTGDGRTDLFVGGRLKTRDYPHPTRSYLLRNDGGRFTDVTRETAPGLADPGGMVTDAVWIDFNDDGRPDLVTAGEWMPIRFYENDGKRLNDVTDSMNLPGMRGWWYSLETGDFNNDGRPDLAAGNLGLNHTYSTSPESKFGVVAGNFSGYRTTEIIFTKEQDGTEYPFYGLVKLGREIYTLGIRFDSFEAFANAPIEQVVGSSALDEALRYQVDTFASVRLMNNGDGTFSRRRLPNLAQISPIYDIIATDVDGDGHTDLIAAGNMYHSEPTGPRADAGNGLWLKGDGSGDFVPVPPMESGFLAPLDVKSLALVHTNTGRIVLVGNNDDSLQVFNINTPH